MKRLLSALLALAALCVGTALAGEAITSVAQLNDPSRTVGVSTGSISESTVKEELPDAKIAYYNDNILGYADVASGKIDAFVYDQVQMGLTIRSGQKGVRLLDETMARTTQIAVGISQVSRIPDLQGKIDRFIAELRADGTLDDMYARWVLNGDETMPDIAPSTGSNGRLVVATTGTVPPYSYFKGVDLNGYDIELARRFAAWLDMELSFETMDFGAVVPAVRSGKVDCVMSNLQVSAGRMENFLYSDALFEEKQGVMVRDDSTAEPAGDANDRGALAGIGQLNGKRIGVQTGTTFDEIVLGALPDAQISYFNSYADMAEAVKSQKIDAFPGDEPVLRMMAADDDRLEILDGRLDSFEFAFVLPRTTAGEKLMAEMNDWLDALKESGELQRITDKWTVGAEADKTVPDYASLPATNGVLRMVTEGGYAPMCYYRGESLVGMEIDLAAMFCEANGYGLIVEDMNFDGILPAIQAGKADFAAAGITITEERRESVNFSQPYYEGGTVMAALKRETAAPQEAPAGGFTSLDQLDGRRIGVQTGTTGEEITLRRLPNAQISYYSTFPDMAVALKTNRIDGFPGDGLVLKKMAMEDPALVVLDEKLRSYDCGFVLAKSEKGRALCEELNAWIRDMRDKGELDRILKKWTESPESERTVPDYRSLPAPKGTLTMTTEGTFPPMNYYRGEELVGMEIELCALFCEANGYGLNPTTMAFEGMLAAVQTGKVDFAISGIAITEERKESVLFSDPYYTGGTLMAVLRAGKAEETGFWAGIRSSFQKTFLREERWRLFASGVVTTLVITLLSIILGTALGFAVFMICRNGNPAANLITHFCLWLVQGMPMVVLLMVLYYIIFGSVAISGILVAVIGFTLTFGAAVFGLLKMGVGAVDGGQYEAAYALGYSNRRTFYRIILPQALPHVMSAYRGEIVGLIKATAIVGYIAVQDLTKMGDIVRSRTYEAFFPLIAVTVIYFVLEGLIGFAVSRIGTDLDPRKRSREHILKGVKTDDPN
ncbi:MAG: transporter substrate-binding domain-containing protein [Clostridia bacterium]|nr:transporter substrate-binding domain-containing protein [Clostridia bacterium]